MVKDIMLNVVLLNGILVNIVCQNDVSLSPFSSLLGRRGKEVPLLPQDLEVPSSIQPKGSTKMEQEQFIFNQSNLINYRKWCHKLERHPRVVNYAPRVINYVPKEHVQYRHPSWQLSYYRIGHNLNVINILYIYLK